MDLRLGRLRPEGGFAVNPDAVSRMEQVTETPQRCRECFCRPSCAGGCWVNHSYPGAPASYDDFCLQTRLITATELLRDLDAAELAEEMLARRPWAEALAWHTDDRLVGEGEQ
jgi:hypothetical protein